MRPSLARPRRSASTEMMTPTLNLLDSFCERQANRNAFTTKSPHSFSTSKQSLFFIDHILSSKQDSATGHECPARPGKRTRALNTASGMHSQVSLQEALGRPPSVLGNVKEKVLSIDRTNEPISENEDDLFDVEKDVCGEKLGPGTDELPNRRRKVRRSRTTFTTYQLHQLERSFEKVGNCVGD